MTVHWGWNVGPVIRRSQVWFLPISLSYDSGQAVHTHAFCHRAV